MIKQVHEKKPHLCFTNLMIMKKFVFILLAGMVSINEAAPQTPELVIKNAGKEFYLEHKTAVKENFFSIGRLYSVHPRHIAAFNTLDMNKGLSLGQIISIPLSDSNFSQKVNKGRPVFYFAGENESLSKISSLNKVPVENIRRWNNLSGDKLATGKKLIVGFLISGELTTGNEAVSKTATPVITKSEESKKDVSVAKPAEELKTVEVKPVVIVKEETKKAEPVFLQVNNEVKTEEKEEGFFKLHFNRQIKGYPVTKEETVTSGIFKTASGWQDKKYFILINKVEPGTIVKVTNPSNTKVIYAKVLYGMEGIRQNLGLDIRISNAAANALAITDTEKFIVKVNY